MLKYLPSEVTTSSQSLDFGQVLLVSEASGGHRKGLA